MKYCPYCGVTLAGDTVSFCQECGKQLVNYEKTEKQANLPDTQTRKKEKEKRMRKQKSAKSKTPKGGKFLHKKEYEEPVDEAYDGYYDDVLPPDYDRIKDNVDKELIKKIAAVAGVVILIISLCVGVLYIL